MRPTAYVATTSFGNLCLSLCVTMTYKLLTIGLIGVMIIRMWSLLPAFVTISATIVRTTSHLLSFGFVGLLMLEICQGFGLHDIFINR